MSEITQEQIDLSRKLWEAGERLPDDDHRLFYFPGLIPCSFFMMKDVWEDGFNNPNFPIWTLEDGLEYLGDKGIPFIEFTYLEIAREWEVAVRDIDKPREYTRFNGKAVEAVLSACVKVKEGA